MFPDRAYSLCQRGAQPTPRTTEDTMTATDNFTAAAINWTPAAEGLCVGILGVQREGGAVGHHELYIVRRRRLSSNGYEYGLSWVRGRIITALFFGAVHLGEISDWPWDEGCSSAVTWFKTRRAAFAAAFTA